MPITPDTLVQIKHDHYTGPDNLILNIPPDDPLWVWFMETASQYIVHPEYNGLFNDGELPSGNCHGNSVKIAHFWDLDYCEGFVKVNGVYVLHGFNLIENRVMDGTVQSNRGAFRDLNGNLPSEYCGIIFPETFLPDKPVSELDDIYSNLRPLMERYLA